MTKPDIALMAPSDLVAALGLLTRLPVPVDIDRAQARGAAAAWAWPLVGLVTGGIAAFVGQIGLWVGLPAAICAGLVLATLATLTGAMHEDGLADCADGFWGGWTVARRLEIMKDSAIGTYGVLALILSVGLRWTALTALAAGGNLWPAVLAAAILSRVPMVAVMAALPPARDNGLGRSVGQPSPRTAALAAVIGLACAVLLVGLMVVPLGLAGLAAATATAAIARAKVGGQTGDVLGATQQVCELALLLTLSALAG